MFQLIISVMSIALIGATAMATVNYVDTTLPIQKQAQLRVERGFESLHLAWDAYRDSNQTYAWVCDTHVTAEGSYEDCQKSLDDPGYLPVSNWSTTLTPQYGFMPQPPQGMNWSYGTNATGWYFCAEGDVSAPQLKGIFRAEGGFPVGSFYVSDTCGVTSGETLATAAGAGLKITYWLKRN